VLVLSNVNNRNLKVDVSLSLSNAAGAGKGSLLQSVDGKLSRQNIASIELLSPMSPVRKKIEISKEGLLTSQASSVEKEKNETMEFDYVNPELALLYTNRDEQIQTQKLTQRSTDEKLEPNSKETL
jgi:hypothetical protein